MSKKKSLDTPNFRPRLFGIALVVAAIAASGIFLVSRFAEIDYSRDLRNWQDKLNLIANSRAHEVSGWVDTRFSELKKLAGNPSLQLYFTELKTMPTPAGNAQETQTPIQEPPQRTYLRNLLLFTADRLGFAPTNLPMSMQIPAQLPYQSTSGLAVVDNQNNIVVSTPYLSALNETLLQRLQQTKSGAPVLLDIQGEAEDKAFVGFAVPVFAIQADPDSAEPVGRIIGITQLEDGFYKLLKHPGLTEKTLEAVLVRKDGENIAYLSPLLDGTPAGVKKLPDQPEKLAESYAAANPESFVAKRDYESKDVLATGRNIPNTPWTLVVKINASEALAESNMRRGGMIALLFAILGLIVAVVVAVWYVASSRRASSASRYFKRMAEKTAMQERLLKLVTDNQSEAIYLLDGEQRYRFANKAAAQSSDMPAFEMNGKALIDVLGAARAQSTIESFTLALEKDEPVVRIRQEEEKNITRIIRAEHIPIAEIPVAGMKKKMPGVLVVEQDISEVVHEREGHLRAQQQLIDTLIMLVDKRDPHAANHSLLVSQIAYEVATAMELPVSTRETARITGLLMNIGKLIVPEQVLTKRESLSEGERKSIRRSIYISAELLHGIQFDGPVCETLRQSQEHWDGTGPEGMSGEEILLPARIIAVVNAFVGMISPRSYRAAFAPERAMRLLLDSVDTRYDRKVVIAFVNFLENQGGRQMLDQWTLARGAA